MWEMTELSCVSGREAYYWCKGNYMTQSLPKRIQRVVELAGRPDTSPEFRILADAILYLATQGERQKENNRSAFEQIEELDRRQGPGDSGPLQTDENNLDSDVSCLRSS
jgi:hypothetical protein